MSWQERVERYKAEQKEAAILKKERELRITKEKTASLLEVLERLNCRDLLLQIRDEVWKLGDVIVTPNLDTDSISPYIIEASVKLIAKWPYYSPGGWGTGSAPDFYDYYEEPSIGIEVQTLSINAEYGGVNNGSMSLAHALYEQKRFDEFNDLFKEIFICPRSNLNWSYKNEFLFFRADHPDDTQSRLETFLIKDIMARQKLFLPYDELKRKAEPRVLEAIVKEGLKPPEGFEYLLDLAEKRESSMEPLQGAQPEAPSLGTSLGRSLRKLLEGRIPKGTAGENPYSPSDYKWHD